MSRILISIDWAWNSKPSARAIGAAARASALVVVDPNLGEHAAEVLRTEGGCEARGTARGQRVVRAGDVVAEGGAGTDEEAARVGDAWGELLGQRAEQLEVLRSKGLRELECVLVRGHQHQAADGLGLWQITGQPLGEGVQQCGVGRDADDGGAGAVLCLRDQVERKRLERIAAVDDRQQVAGPGKGVDADAPGELALCLLHEEVAGSDDHIDRR